MRVAWRQRWIYPASAVLSALLLGGCVSATVDEMTYNEPVAGIGESSVVILGRRHAPDYDTEFDFIECIGDHIHSGDHNLREDQREDQQQHGGGAELGPELQQ